MSDAAGAGGAGAAGCWGDATVRAGAAACGAVEGSWGRSSDPPQFEQKRPLGGLLVPQRVHLRSGGFCGENSNCGAAGRIEASFERGAGAGGGGGWAKVEGGAKNGGAAEGVAGAGGFDDCAAGASPRGGVGATPAPSPEIRRFPQS
ncbi:MAG TPA: hypothetical protein VFK05_09695 [Polyangiaceae bacterium]|nr:hypothetical protein [Polyangiaceae bacterium]